MRWVLQTEKVTAIVESTGDCDKNGWPVVIIQKILRNRSGYSNLTMMEYHKFPADPSTLRGPLEEPGNIIKGIL